MSWRARRLGSRVRRRARVLPGSRRDAPYSLLETPAAPPTRLDQLRGDAAAQAELFRERRRDRDAVTPLRVQTKRFRRAWWGRGYAAGEVDAYLQQVAEELIRLRQACQGPSRPGGQEPADSRVIGRVLALAVKTADRLVAQAWVRAADIVEQAHRQAQEITEDAQDRPGQPVDGAGPDAVVLPGPWHRQEGGGHDQKRS